MNLRIFTFAILASTLPLKVSAGPRQISLERGDFLHAKKLTRNGETKLRVKLSKSGKAKLKKLNRDTDLALDGRIIERQLEMGPLTLEEADALLANLSS